jgi:asparagine synthetase B (glutamine-hydrolysing)
MSAQPAPIPALGPRRAVPALGEIEVLTNLPLGRDGSVAALPPPAPGGIRAALEGVLMQALSRTPCVVSFSGGRDSSAVLALACDVARRHGLEEPVPVIMRFPGEPASEESGWQRLVLEHLRLGRAEVLTLRDELDALGPAARSFLTRHGVRWPGNVHMHAPILELARGGTLLTGIGGDELFDTRALRRSPRAAAAGSLPRSLRAEIRRRRHPPATGAWLTPLGRSLVRLALARDETAYPYRWDRALEHWHRSRAFAALDGTIALLAADHGVQVVNPLLEPPVLAELRRAGGRRGFASREQAMRWLCGSLLPEQLLARQTKAGFTRALWGPATREFAATWEGTGVNPRHVHAARLRVEILSEQPDFRSILLVQRSWLATTDGASDG